MEESKPTYEELERRLHEAEAMLHVLQSKAADAEAANQEQLEARLAETQAREAHIKQVLLAIRNVNQLITHENDRRRLIERACVNLTETLGYFTAWIALLDEKGRQANMAASSGFGGGFEAMRIRFEQGDFPSCVRDVLASHELLIRFPSTDCTDCPLSFQYGGRSSMIHTLDHSGKCYGIIAVSVSSQYIDDVEERALFVEIAGDLAFALHKLEAAEAFHASEDANRLLMENSNSGIAIHEIVLDDSGEPINYKFIAVNPAFEKHTGLRKADIIGRRITDVISGSERAPYIEIYGEVALGGEPVTFERYFEPLKRHFSIRAYRTAEKRFATVFEDITERKQAEEAMRESEEQVQRKLAALLEPDLDVSDLTLSDVVDVKAMQSFMDDFSRLTRIPIAMLDASGKILVASGWQDICTQFHRIHPETQRNCLESDLYLTQDVKPGTARLYHCKNMMWDIATPLFFGEQHIGNIFLGQFLFEDEQPDRQLFIEQARRYGFNEEKYLEALDRMPRFSRENIDIAMRFLAKLATLISMLSYGNIRLARALVEREKLIGNLRKSEERYRVVSEMISDFAYALRIEPDGQSIIEWATPGALSFGVSPLDGFSAPSKKMSIVHPDDMAREQQHRKTLLSGRPDVCEFRISDKDGQEHWLRDYGHPVWDEALNRVSCIYGSTQEITERKQAEEALRKSEEQVQRKLTALMEPDADLSDLRLSDVINVEAVQSFMNDFHQLSGIGFAILDTSGEVLISLGWQEICLNFHRAHPEACKNCTESDLYFSEGLKPGEIKMYRCKNMMWDIATPMYLGEHLVGNIYIGQFLFDDEEPDRQLFIEQARRYGFDEKKYLEALDRLPRFSRVKIEITMRFLAKLGSLISLLSYGNIRLARALAEREKLLEDLSKSEERYRVVSEIISDFAYALRIEPDGKSIIEWATPGVLSFWAYSIDELNARGGALSIVHSDDISRARQHKEALLSGKPDVCELRVFDKDGQEHWLRNYAHPVWDEERHRVSRIYGSAQDITERKQAEEALRHSEERFRSYVENAHDMVYTLSLEGIFTYVSPNWLKFVGEPANEAVGRSFEYYVHLNEIPACREFFIGVTKRGESLKGVEYRVRRKDGVWRWHTSTGSPLRDSDGNILSYIGISQDITEQRQAEMALQASESRYRQVAETAIEIILVHGMDGQITYINRAGLDFFNCEESEILRRNIKEFIPEEHLDILLKRHAQRLQGEGKALLYELEVTNMDGQRVPVEISSALMEENGVYDRVLIVARDITKRKHAETEHEKMLLAIEQTSEVIVITGADACITYVNPAFERTTGYSWAEVIGQNPRILKSGKQDDAFYQEMWSQLSSGMTWHGQFVNKRKDGTHYTEDVVISPIHDSSGQVVSYVAVKHDITEELRLNAERAALEAQFQQAQKLESVGRLAGGVAHDLNNLLSPILGYGEILLDEFGIEDTRRASVEEIIEAGTRARDLVRQLLAFSRKQVLEFKPIDLNRVLTQFEKLLRRTIREDIAISITYGTALPLIKGDIGQIEQVIMNLAVNAQDAMPQGGILYFETSQACSECGREAVCTNDAHHHQVCLEVRDTGFGMSAITCEHIFEPFFTTKAIDKGTGLGLATVYGIVRQHGGTIHVQSELGGGTVFIIRFPVSHEPMPEEEHMQAAQDNVYGTETILLVEDNEQVKKITQTILRMHGYTVLTAQDGRDALSILEQYDKPVHLLLTDVVMPEMNGPDLYATVAARYPHVKVLYMSGYADNEVAMNGAMVEGENFIHKPFSIKALAAILRKLLDGE